jgi:hypothetical protein
VGGFNRAVVFGQGDGVVAQAGNGAAVFDGTRRAAVVDAEDEEEVVAGFYFGQSPGLL